MKAPKIKRITEREQFVKLAQRLGVRPDWHEPDEQEVDVRVRGTDFDNAGYWPYQDGFGGRLERYVEFRKYGLPIAVVNLADLCAWASEATAVAGESSHIEGFPVEDVRRTLPRKRRKAAVR